MPTTPLLALRYPAPSASPDVPFNMQALAEDVEAQVDRKLAVLEYSGTAQSIPTAAYTVLTNAVTTVNRGLTVSNAAGTITVPAAGTYLITGAVSFASNATGLRYAAIGVNTVVTRVTTETALTAAGTTVTVATMIPLPTGAVVDLRAFQSSGANLNAGGGILTNLSVLHVGR